MDDNKEIEYCNHCSQPVNAKNYFLQESEEGCNFGDKLADKVASFVGSWKYIGIQTFILFAWIGINLYVVYLRFDPFPFILLNLFFSFLAGYQAPLILMSQNRQSYKDRIRAENDFRVNVISEIHIQEANKKLELLLHLNSDDKV